MNHTWVTDDGGLILKLAKYGWLVPTWLNQSNENETPSLIIDYIFQNFNYNWTHKLKVMLVLLCLSKTNLW